MKRNISIIIAVLALAGVGAISQNSNSNGKDPAPKKREAVVMWANQAGFNDGHGYQYNGAVVYCSSSSAGAPRFPQYRINGTNAVVELGEAIATMLDAGFTMQSTGDNGQTYIWVK